MDPVEPLDPLPGNPGTPLFLPDWLARRAALTPERTALLWRGEARTFAELDTAATRMAQGLRALGVLPGDRVALLLGNGPPFVELLHGAGRAGAVLVPLNLRLRPPELAWQVADAAPRLLLFEEGTASLAAILRPELPGLAMAPVEERDGWAGGSAAGEPPGPGPGLPPGFRVDLAAPHTLLYTSGTSGRPKGAILTYGNLWWSAVGSLLHQGLHHDDWWLACLPLFHVGGLGILVRAVLAGVPVILHERFDPVAANRAIDQQGATLVSLVATMLVRMLEARGDTPYPPSLRCLLVGGGPVPAALVEACARRGIPVSPAPTGSPRPLPRWPPSRRARRAASPAPPGNPSSPPRCGWYETARSCLRGKPGRSWSGDPP